VKKDPGLGGLRSLRSKMMLSAEKRRGTHVVSNLERKQWIEHYLERETAVARNRVPDAEAAGMQELKVMTTAESAGATMRQPATTFEKKLNAIGDSLSNLASSDDEQDGEDEEDDEEDTVLGKLSDGDEPGLEMCTISKTVQHRIEKFRQTQMRLDEFMQLGLGETANFFRERDMKNGAAESKVPVVVKHQIYTTASTTTPTIFRQHMHTLDVVRAQCQMLAVISPAASSPMRVGSEKPELHKFLPVLSHEGEPDSTLIHNAMAIQPVSV